MASREVTLTKTSAEMKLGVRLSGSAGYPVKVVETNADGPLAKIVKKNDIIEAINGVPMTEGHQKAAEMMRSAVGDLVLTVSSKKPSITQRLLGKSGKLNTPPSGNPGPAQPSPSPKLPKQVSYTSIDMPTTPAQPSPSPMTPASTVAETPEPSLATPSPAVVAAVPASPAPPSVPAPSFPAPPAKPPATLSPAKPPATLPPATPTPAAPPPMPTADELAFDEYSVVLQRNKTASIGMRLVQKKHTDLPYIQDIDPQGPAAKTSICVGDILLEVNGVDARASHDELKRALGSTDAAVLKLRRATRQVMQKPMYSEVERAAIAAPHEAPTGGFSLFGCCATNRMGVAK